MLFDPVFSTEIKRWLTSHLEPICDADPEVLADYVVALLKNDSDAAQLEETLKDQLQDFLADSTAAFSKETIEMLVKKTYLPASTSAIPTGPAADAGGASAGRKRRAPSEDPRQDGDGSSKTMRAGGDVNGNSDAWSSRRTSGRQDVTMADDKGAQSLRQRMHVPNGYCRDFHVRGFCSRGDSCKYTHLPPPGGMPFAPNTTQAAPSQDVDMSMGDVAMGGMPAPTPEQMQQMAAAFGFPMMPDPSMFGLPNMNGFQAGPSGRGGGRGGFNGGQRRGGGRGTFNSGRRSQTTLVIENVPQEHLDLIQVNDRFKRFGTITNIQIDKGASKALVSYSTPDEAKRAHSDPDVIFGSRFVKVYFQQLDEQQGDGQAGKQGGSAAQPSPAKPYTARPPPASRKVVTEADVKMMQADVRAKQTSLQALLDEQKTLMGSIGTLDADKKKEAMNRLRELGLAIPAATQQAKDAAEKLQNAGPVTPLPQSTKALLEKAKKKQLDRELDAIAQRPMNVDGAESGAAAGTGEGENTEALKAKLESLKAEAASLGLDPASASAAASPRGRGRGRFPTRGYAARGRGGFSRAFASLDNRPKELYVENKTESGELIEGEKREKLEAWLKGYGEITSITSDEGAGKFIVTWKNRHEGDKAVWSGGNLPDVGKLKMQWAPQTASSPAPAASASTPETAGDDAMNGTS